MENPPKEGVSSPLTLGRPQIVSMGIAPPNPTGDGHSSHHE